MANMHPLMVLGFILVAAVAVAQVSNFASAPDGVAMVAAGPAQAGDVAAPNDEAQPVSLVQSPKAETDAAQNSGPSDVGLMPSYTLKSVMLRADPEPAAPSPAPSATASAAPS